MHIKPIIMQVSYALFLASFFGGPISQTIKVFPGIGCKLFKEEISNALLIALLYCSRRETEANFIFSCIFCIRSCCHLITLFLLEESPGSPFSLPSSNFSRLTTALYASKNCIGS
uniref:U3-Sparatoxin-Hju1a_1 n=1 Tax=Heteropoda jugulans TaxID=1358901 RepID=A0A4Q8K1Y5_9ARAC